MTSFNDLYAVGKQIGKGGFGKVYAGQRRSDGLSVAIKFIAKRRVVLWHTVGQKKVPLELVLLENLQSIPSVIRLIEHFEFSECFVLVMERLEGMDMFDYINEQTYLNESEAKRLFAQVLRTVMECHKNGVVHRDIKDENIIVERKTGKIKLIDFGSGAFMNPNDEVFTDFEGTRVYAPPEWISSRKYKAEPSTVWQLGILLFDMVFGNIPFETDTQILAARLTWFRPVSRECRELIAQCLSVNASDRPSLEQMAQHSWIAASMKELETLQVCSDNCIQHITDLTDIRQQDSQDAYCEQADDVTCVADTDVACESVHATGDSSGYSSSGSGSGFDSERHSSDQHVDCAVELTADRPKWIPKIFSVTFNCMQSKMHNMGIM